MRSLGGSSLGEVFAKRNPRQLQTIDQWQPSDRQSQKKNLDISIHTYRYCQKLVNQFASSGRKHTKLEICEIWGARSANYKLRIAVNLWRKKNSCQSSIDFRLSTFRSPLIDLTVTDIDRSLGDCSISKGLTLSASCFEGLL